MLFKVINLFLLVGVFLGNVQGECNVCSPDSGLACVSDNKFQVCVGDIPTGTINTCPSGMVCSSVGSRICQELGPNTIKACQECNKCDATNTFACTGPDTYVLCLGTTTPSQSAGSCQTNYVCNRSNRYICENSAAGSVATCFNVETSTTPSPVQDPVGFCRAKKQNGRFPVGLDTESTCRHYVYCFLNGGVWSGQLYKCAASTYFNSSTRLCDSNVPAGCV